MTDAQSIGVRRKPQGRKAPLGEGDIEELLALLRRLCSAYSRERDGTLYDAVCEVNRWIIRMGGWAPPSPNRGSLSPARLAAVRRFERNGCCAGQRIRGLVAWDERFGCWMLTMRPNGIAASVVVDYCPCCGRRLP